LDSKNRWSGGLKSPWGPGAKPVGGMGNEVPQKVTTVLGLKVYFFTQNTSIISYFNKFGLLIFLFWTPHFVVWTPHFGWALRLNNTVNVVEVK